MPPRTRSKPSLWLAAAAAVASWAAGGEPAAVPPGRPHPEVMAARGFVRHRNTWRTPQEIELIERAARADHAAKQWRTRLERLRRQLDVPAEADRAAEELREIADVAAVPALAAALGREAAPHVRLWYVEALGRIGAAEAVAVLVATALDHPDPEVRRTAVERLVRLGPEIAAPSLVAALGSADNAQVNRAAEALAGLGLSDVVPQLIDALETRHVVMTGDGTAEGSTTATFTPTGGGFSTGGGPKRFLVPVRNERVLAALVALTGTNLQWDRQAWRDWLAARRSPPAGFDPRRD